MRNGFYVCSAISRRPRLLPCMIYSTCWGFSDAGSSRKDTRSHFSEFFYRASQDLQRSVDFFLRVRASERETQTCALLLIGKANRSTELRRFQLVRSPLGTARAP